MNPETAKRLRLLASACSVIALLAVGAGFWIAWRVRASLPLLDGRAQIAGLSAAVAVERDSLGVPTLRAANRADIARALGWVHAQDRFFQMDLLRRVAAGELSELFGRRALPRDRLNRRNGFRRLAQTVLERLEPAHREILEAYTVGVNAGRSALRAPPWEYLVLRAEPQPWRAEDSILVIYAMTLELQDQTALYERSLLALRDEFGVEALAFFAPTITPDDASLDGTRAPVAPIPSANVLDLRTRKLVERPRAKPARSADAFPFSLRDPDAVPGSNAFALAGTHTASGAGLLANDMHLDHAVPNMWYRASFEYEGRKITGITLPGAPAMVSGSNGRVAWGFTSAYVDTSDVVIVETNSIAPHLYSTPDGRGLTAIEQRKETIRIKGSDPVEQEYSWTIWGPIIGDYERHRVLAHRWVAHDPATTDLNLLRMETAQTTAEAVEIAHRAGIPAQNILIADRDGAVAWTIAGRLPKRVGYDGRLPVTWSFGDRRWEGYLAPEEVPTVFGPASVLPGRLWSANNRHVGGEALAKLGDGAFQRAARARQIRDDLAPLARATPRDLLGVQLDDRALFLAPWHRLMMETLSPAVTEAKKPRAILRSYVEKWEGRATTDAVSYRLVRSFRDAVFERVFPPIFAACVERFPDFDWSDFQLEDAMWALLKEKPPHLLNPKFTSWHDLLVAAIDDVILEIDQQGVRLPQNNWGFRNTARIRHPFSNSFPWLASWINMPADPLPGDIDMPRTQTPGHGTSERLVVAPGHEQEGIFHMPGGQSAHPLSPFFRAGHEAWLKGEATPFLPGATAHTVTLQP